MTMYSIGVEMFYVKSDLKCGATTHYRATDDHLVDVLKQGSSMDIRAR